VPPLNEGGLGESSPKAAELLAALGHQIAFEGLVKGLREPREAERASAKGGLPEGETCRSAVAGHVLMHNDLFDCQRRKKSEH
jgi:hypothetical protein